jgi:hypothetical protein
MQATNELENHETYFNLKSKLIEHLEWALKGANLY